MEVDHLTDPRLRDALLYEVWLNQLPLRDVYSTIAAGDKALRSLANKHARELLTEHWELKKAPEILAYSKAVLLPLLRYSSQSEGTPTIDGQRWFSLLVFLARLLEMVEHGANIKTDGIAAVLFVAPSMPMQVACDTIAYMRKHWVTLKQPWPMPVPGGWWNRRPASFLVEDWERLPHGYFVAGWVSWLEKELSFDPATSTLNIQPVVRMVNVIDCMYPKGLTNHYAKRSLSRENMLQLHFHSLARFAASRETHTECYDNLLQVCFAASILVPSDLDIEQGYLSNAYHVWLAKRGLNFGYGPRKGDPEILIQAKLLYDDFNDHRPVIIRMFLDKNERYLRFLGWTPASFILYEFRTRSMNFKLIGVPFTRADFKNLKTIAKTPGQVPLTLEEIKVLLKFIPDDNDKLAVQCVRLVLMLPDARHH